MNPIAASVRSVFVAAVVNCVAVAMAEAQIAVSPPVTGLAEKLAEMPGLEALWRLDSRVIRGGAPAGEAGMTSLKALGVRTILSVEEDPAEQALAERHGLRRVEVPFGYDGFTVEDARRIMDVLNGKDGPFYVHCQHGKHRGGAATAIYRRVVSGMDAEAAIAEMIALGCSRKYKGLVASVRDLDVAKIAPWCIRLPEMAGLVDPVRHGGGIVRGSVPAGDAGWRSLARLGIRSIVEVGADTLGDAPRRHALECASLPAPAGALTRAEAARILETMDRLTGPIYVCGPGARLAVAVHRISRRGVAPEQAAAELVETGGSADESRELLDIPDWSALARAR